MKHKLIPLFALPVTAVPIDQGDTATFFDDVVKPSKGRSNTDGTERYKTPLVHYHNEANVFEIHD